MKPTTRNLLTSIVLTAWIIGYAFLVMSNFNWKRKYKHECNVSAIWKNSAGAWQEVAMSIAQTNTPYTTSNGFQFLKIQPMNIEQWTAPIDWCPKIGERVATLLQPDGTVGGLRIVTLTNVVHVGKARCQTGILVYGDGLPGVDSSWVKPAP